MNARVLILRAGSAISSNVVRSLRAGDPSLRIVGCHTDRFVLRKSDADANYLIPPGSDTLLAALASVIEKERIDLVIPTLDADVLAVADIAGRLPCRTFLPRKEVIEVCQDKYALTTLLRDRGIPAPATYAVTSNEDIERAFEVLRPQRKLWCRIRSGTGSFGAIPVDRPEQVRSWIDYWHDMRGVQRGAFTLSEYLPGRDFAVQSVWHDGKLVLHKMAERLVYLDNGSPSGVSSMPALAKTAQVPRVLETCEAAVRAVDPAASGVFFIDVKESASSAPCITEINAGRFGAMTNIFDLAGEHNTAVTYVKLALKEPVGFTGPGDYAPEYYFVRSLDTLPAVFHRTAFYDGIERVKV